MNDDAVRERTAIILAELEAGNERALEDLLGLVYQDLRAMARRIFGGQGAGHTLEPTALVHEVYLRFVDQESARWTSKAHFLAVAARAMRQILVDHHRRRHAAKRGGGRRRVTLSGIELTPRCGTIDFLALEEALSRLAALDERQGRVVELRFFGGLTVGEIARVLGVSRTTVESDWRHARAWLQLELGEGDER